MPFLRQELNLQRTLIILTALFILTQIALLIITLYVDGMLDIARYAIASKLFFTRAVIPPFLQFLSAQIIVYIFFTYVVEYLSVSIGELFCLRPNTTYGLGIFIWVNSILLILVLNMHYVTNSIFTLMIQQFLFENKLNAKILQLVLFVVMGMNLLLIFLAFINMCLNLSKRRHFAREGIMLFLIVSLIFLLESDHFQMHKKLIPLADKTNVIIIGFDALRPDFLSFFNKQHSISPHFDEFLQASTVFKQAYSPVARTMPAWTSLLTSQYALHNQVRENNTYLDSIHFNETLVKTLQQSGYETIYATDDRRFNSVDYHYGFDRVVGPSGTVADYLIGSLNDFPLSNLLVPTFLGKILFPYNHANHGSAHTYDPDNFLNQLENVINQRSNKPLFLAVHFNITGWPFYWFNDQLAYNEDKITRYSHAIKKGDQVLAKFLFLLRENKLLKNAIVVLLSDHGVTLGLHGDRVIKEDLYQGDKRMMKVRRTRYADADTRHRFFLNNKSSAYQEELADSLFNIKNYGVDTSIGYGGDVLSLIQNQSLLAIRGYGVHFDKPHQVTGLSLLLDVAPTLLDLLSLPALQHAEGISLKPYLLNHQLLLPHRPIYLETAYSLMEMEQPEIVVPKVLKKSLAFFYINPNTGLVALNPPSLKKIFANKQRAILNGDWLLAYYPVSERFTILRSKLKLNLVRYQISPYFVLVNLRTGKWATDMNDQFVLNSPINKLKQQLYEFYGHEMDFYNDKTFS